VELGEHHHLLEAEIHKSSWGKLGEHHHLLEEIQNTNKTNNNNKEDNDNNSSSSSSISKSKQNQFDFVNQSSDQKLYSNASHVFNYRENLSTRWKLPHVYLNNGNRVGVVLL
jgi:hypothetical protein